MFLKRSEELGLKVGGGRGLLEEEVEDEGCKDLEGGGGAGDALEEEGF